MFDIQSHKKNILLTMLLLAELGLLLLLFFSMTFFTELPFTLKNSQTTANPFVTLSEKDLSKKISKMETQNSTLEKQINRTVAGQSYMVVNVSTNKFRLFTKGQMVREGLCSTGTNVLLTTDNEKKKWFFSTPKGMHTIIGKTTSPVWIKPDWAFVEEGLPIPPATSDLRYEYGVLGDYAMSLGHGYLIHGTLYKRFLGMPATHGCIRLDDEDLEVVYTTLSIGSKVFIF
jgi:hypothetical protein